MLIQTTIGTENWDIGGSKVYLFVCPTSRHPLTGKEMHLFDVAKQRSSNARMPTISAVGNPAVTPAGLGMKPEIAGKWTDAVYDVPDSVLLKLMVQRSQNGNAKSINVLFSMREGAALRRIRIPTIVNRRSTRQTVTIEGRFDVLSLQEAALVGYAPPAPFVPSFLPSRWSAIPGFQVIEVSPENVARPVVRTTVVENSAGEAVSVPVVHRHRALDL